MHKRPTTEHDTKKALFEKRPSNLGVYILKTLEGERVFRMGILQNIGMEGCADLPLFSSSSMAVVQLSTTHTDRHAQRHTHTVIKMHT